MWYGVLPPLRHLMRTPSKMCLQASSSRGFHVYKNTWSPHVPADFVKRETQAKRLLRETDKCYKYFLLIHLCQTFDVGTIVFNWVEGFSWRPHRMIILDCSASLDGLSKLWIKLENHFQKSQSYFIRHLTSPLGWGGLAECTCVNSIFLQS